MSPTYGYSKVLWYDDYIYRDIGYDFNQCSEIRDKIHREQNEYSIGIRYTDEYDDIGLLLMQKVDRGCGCVMIFMIGRFIIKGEYEFSCDYGVYVPGVCSEDDTLLVELPKDTNVWISELLEGDIKSDHIRHVYDGLNKYLTEIIRRFNDSLHIHKSISGVKNAKYNS